MNWPFPYAPLYQDLATREAMERHWSLKLLAGPATELLDRAGVKLFLRVDDGSEDAFIDDEIVAARQRCERVTKRSLLVSTYTLSLDVWPCSGEILFPRTPLREVVAIKYIATDGTLTTVEADQYEVDADSEPGRVKPAYGLWWPVTRWAHRAVQITFRAGYDTTAEISDVADIRSRMRACVGYCYRNREMRDEAMLDGLFESLWNGVL